MNIFSLDIGIASVGSAVLEVTKDGDPIRIVTAGSRIFDKPEDAQTGESLALPRRQARGSRRRTRRRKHRLDRIKGLLQSSNVITKEELELVYQKMGDIYQIRCESLDRQLSKEEFSHLMVHLAKRRGFKSNRKSGEGKQDAEQGLLLTAVEENKKRMAEGHYRTIGEMFYKDIEFAENKRNKDGEYKNTVSRSLMVEEIETIFEAQRQLGSTFATEEFEKKYLEIFCSQRSFAEGPGGESPYGGNQIEKMIGKCTFIPDEPRGVRASYTCEQFVLLQKINQLTIVSLSGKRPLSEEERNAVVALAHQTENLTYKQIRKTLQLTDEETFNMLSYGDKLLDEVEKAKFTFLKTYHTMRKALKSLKSQDIETISVADRDAIAYIFTCYKTDDKIAEELEKLNLTDEQQKALVHLPAFRGVGNLSIQAMTKIIPFLKQGEQYHTACENAGYHFRGHHGLEKSRYLPQLRDDMHEITNPVVKRAIRQTINVINGMVKKYGSPCKIHLELAREVSKNYKDRQKIEKEQKENFDKNEKVVKRLKNEFGILYPTGQDILKLKLWEEQDGRCVYTRQALAIEKLFYTGYCEIDHIIPYSMSFDDSFTNKVLVHKKANQDKRNRIPLDYIEDKDKFCTWVEMNVKNYRKRSNLLKTSFSEEDSKEMKERNLNDTKFISRFMLNYINDYLLFDDGYAKKKKVVAVNGRVTAYMRNRWGIRKVRENGDLHHAVDAIVIACITDGTIQKVTKYIKYKENEYTVDRETGELLEKHHFPLPWPEFRKEIECRFSNDPVHMLQQMALPNYTDVDIDSIRPLFVSRMKRKKETGQGHKETIVSNKVEGHVIQKVAIHDLKLTKDKLAIENYYNPESDRLLYELILKELQSNDHLDKKKKEEYFRKNPIFKPTPKGGVAPIVKKVKTIEKQTLGVAVHNGTGVASNGDMVRVDIFHVEGDGYYFVPIYTGDLLKKTLPNKASTPHKPYEQWKEMKEEDFLFSLYPNELIKIKTKKPKTFSKVQKESTLPKEMLSSEILVYYKSAGITGASIKVITHDNSYTIASLGIKTLLKMEKYAVDILGEYQVCGKEIRKHPKAKR